VAAFLTDAGFILKPNFYWAADRGVGERGSDQVGEGFLKMTSASGSFCG